MSCECTTECGDDPNVRSHLILGCAKFRARRNPDALATANAKLRAGLAGLVDVMNRLEPDAPEDQRDQAEALWDERKAEAERLLAETE